MDEDNTTDQTAVDTGAEQAQPVTDTPVEAAAVPAVDEPSEPSQDVEAADQPDAPETDEKLRKYAASNGIELDSPGAIKAAQIAMKSQSEATRNFQKASELEKSLVTTSDEYAEVEAQNTGQDPELLKRLQRVEVKESVRDFWNQDGIDRSYEPKMIELLADKPYLAGDLETLYATAVYKSGNIAAVKSQGKREALESLAHRQQAAVPAGNATSSIATPKKKDFKDLSIKEMEAQLGFVRN